MKETVEEKTRALIARAKALGPETNTPVFSRNRSSLHKIIKTKKQADAFMKQLKSA